MMVMNGVKQLLDGLGNLKENNMRNVLFLLVLILTFSCSKRETKPLVKSEISSKQENSTIHEEEDLNWQTGFNVTHNSNIDSIDGKPVRFYIKNPNCDAIAKDFYYGKYGPTDEPKTADLLNLVLSDNDDIRPFYRWILEKTIEISDGALAEYPGVPARKYAEKFPQEFFDYIDADESKFNYNQWTEIISYSGYFDEDDYKNPSKIRKNMIHSMLKNSSEKRRPKITKFAMDCFPDTIKTN